MNILIADDHPLIRKGLLQILSNSPSIKEIYEAGESYEVFENLKSHIIDVLIPISLCNKHRFDINSGNNG